MQIAQEQDLGTTGSRPSMYDNSRRTLAGATAHNHGLSPAGCIFLPNVGELAHGLRLARFTDAYQSPRLWSTDLQGDHN